VGTRVRLSGDLNRTGDCPPARIFLASEWPSICKESKRKLARAAN
jgi:hypothetical protein